jgi:hypothetical protein
MERITINFLSCNADTIESPEGDIFSLLTYFLNLIKLLEM